VRSESATGADADADAAAVGRGRLPAAGVPATGVDNVALHLTDHVLPKAPYRQWTPTFPYALRLALVRNPARTGKSFPVLG
jgi:hypothetical protein